MKSKAVILAMGFAWLAPLETRADQESYATYSACISDANARSGSYYSGVLRRTAPDFQGVHPVSYVYRGYSCYKSWDSWTMTPVYELYVQSYSYYHYAKTDAETITSGRFAGSWWEHVYLDRLDTDEWSTCRYYQNGQAFERPMPVALVRTTQTGLVDHMLDNIENSEGGFDAWYVPEVLRPLIARRTTYQFADATGKCISPIASTDANYIEADDWASLASDWIHSSTPTW